jgi:hypothetical protein
MPNSETSQRRLARVDRYVVLDVCLDRLPGDILHRLSLASKATQAKVKAAVQQRLPQLLQSAGAASAAAAAIDRLRNTDWPETFPEEVEARRVMLWLLSTAGRRVLNRPAAADALMSIPYAYKHGIATAAVGFGFKPSYELILAAAKQQVAGVEQWARCMPAPRHLVPVLWNTVCLNRERLVSSSVSAATCSRTCHSKQVPWIQQHLHSSKCAPHGATMSLLLPRCLHRAMHIILISPL